MNTRDIPRLPERVQSVHVLVAGDVMLDEYVLGTAERISPEAPVPVVDVHTRKFVPGGAANVAMNLHALGAKVQLAAVVGDDAPGRMLLALLESAGVGLAGVAAISGRATTTKTRVVAGQQQIVRIDHEDKSAYDSAAVADFVSSGRRLLSGSQVLVLSDYAKGFLSINYCSAMIATAREKGIAVIVDPKSIDFRKYSGCSVITPNLSEALSASGVAVELDGKLHEVGETLLRILPGTSVLITQGAEGMTLFQENEAPVTMATSALDVFDVVGAGDTVVATLAACLGAGMPIREGMRVANIAAGIVVGKRGTASVSADEIECAERQ